MTSRGYLLTIIADGGGEHPDLRLVKLLRTFGEYGFTLANVQGSDPPSAGMLETIEREHGISYSGVGPTAEQLNRVERIEAAMIERYLARTWHMEPENISSTLARCDADPALQSELLVLAMETP